MDRRVATLGIAILLILAPLGGGASVAASAEGDTNAELENVYETPHDNVSVWDGSIFTLRANTDTAAYTIPEPTLQVSPPDNTGPHPFDYEFGVFNVSEPISLDFEDHQFASTDGLNGKDATVIIAQVEPSAGLADFAPSESFGEAGLEALNEDVSIESVSEEKFDEGGFSTDYTPDESGQYVAMVAVGDDGSSLVNDDDEFDPRGNSTIVGLDGFVVQDDASVVDAPSKIEPGENATLDVETGLDGENVRHGVALYDEETFTGSVAVLNVTAEPDSEFTSDDITIQHGFLGLNGVLTVDGEEEIAGPMTFDNLFEELNEAVADNVPNEATDDVYLDGSVAVNQTDDSSATLTVETFGDWSEGDYRWMHVATSDTGEFETSTDTLEVKADDGNNGGSPGFPSPSPPEEPDYRVSDASLSDAKIVPGDSVDVSAKVQNVGEGTGPFTAELVVDGEVVDDQIVRVAPGQKDTVTFTHTFDEAGEYEVAINDATAGTVTVSDAKPASFEVTNAELSATEIELEETVDVSATVTNTGEETGAFTAELIVDGEVVDEKDVRLFGGDATTVEFSQAFDEAGEYEIAINDADAGTVTVVDPEEDDDDSIPGFGGLAALAALASALFAVRFRSSRD